MCVVYDFVIQIELTLEYRQTYRRPLTEPQNRAEIHWWRLATVHLKFRFRMAAFAISKQKNLMTIVDFLCMRDNCRPVFLNSKFRWQLNFSNGSSETVSARNVLFSGVFIWVLFDEHFSLNKISRIISDAFRYGFQMNHTVRFESQLTVYTTLNGRILGAF